MAVFSSIPDLSALLVVLAGALVAGFTTGFAGFGTGLVASGFWFHALPAPLVPPLVALASVAAQIVGLFAVHGAFDWARVTPYLAGAVVGVPLGVVALSLASPGNLRVAVGAFLVLYAAFQLSGPARWHIGDRGGRTADGAIGAGGGFLGGFAGLSGPLPLIWLQLRGGRSEQQRAIYQPFNLVVLAMASAAMAAGGRIGGDVLAVAGLCLPVTLLGAWIGARVYLGVSEAAFRRVVLVLLLGSGAVLVAQAVL